LGEAMSVYGINFLPVVWWFLATYAESIGIIFIALWLFTRYNAFFLAFTMLTALLTKITWGAKIEKLSELSSIVYIFVAAFALFLSG
jgi:putative oxidoreductase